MKANSRPVVVMFCHDSRSHMIRLLAQVEEFASLGFKVFLFGSERFEDDVVARGGRLVGIHERFGFAKVDPESSSRLLQSVSFTAEYGEEITAEVAALDPSLIVYDSFSILAPLVGMKLDLPTVCICAGSFGTPAEMAQRYDRNPAHHVSDKCLAAVETLRGMGLSDVTRWYCAHARSPLLNVCYDLPEFVSDATRDYLEPVLYTTSLRPPDTDAMADSCFESIRRGPEAGLRIYVSFGLGIWRWFEDTLIARLEQLADIFSRMPDVEVLVTLGGWEPVANHQESLARDNVRVELFVDQWRVLEEADIFITHHGMNSTLEAIYRGVPMLSYPVRGDQPARARRSEELGIALPITTAPARPIEEDILLFAIEDLQTHRDDHLAALARLRESQLPLLAQDASTAERILSHLGPTVVGNPITTRELQSKKAAIRGRAPV